LTRLEGFGNRFTVQRFGNWVRIPAKLNAIPVGSRTAFRPEGEHPSERSDAGTTIVQKVFGFVKWERSKEAGSVIRSEAEEEGH